MRWWTIGALALCLGLWSCGTPTLPIADTLITPDSDSDVSDSDVSDSDAAWTDVATTPDTSATDAAATAADSLDATIVTPLGDAGPSSAADGSATR